MWTGNLEDTDVLPLMVQTVHAVYIISYEYTLEKVTSYTRIPLSQIIKMTKGWLAKSMSKRSL